MNEIKVSVLVPIYNASDYIRECLDSLGNQTLKGMEFILINDGSTDDSLEIMKEYNKKDDRFIVVNKKNSGYGDSLNKGLEMTRGKYVGIVEPDDFCEKRMFEVLYRAIGKNGVDIVRGNYFYHSSDRDSIRKSIFAEKNKIIFNPIDDFKIFCEPPAIWSAIYRKDFLKENKIFFSPTPGASYQDTGFYLKTLACAQKIVFINEPLYYYRVDNPNSSVKDVKKIFAVTEEHKSVEEFVRGLPEGEKLLKYCQVAKFGHYHWNLLRLSKTDALKFITFIKEDFIEERKRGNIEKKYFSKKYWLSLNLLLKTTPKIFWSFFNMRNIMKRFKNVIINER